MFKHRKKKWNTAILEEAKSNHHLIWYIWSFPRKIIYGFNNYLPNVCHVPGLTESPINTEIENTVSIPPLPCSQFSDIDTQTLLARRRPLVYCCFVNRRSRENVEGGSLMWAPWRREGFQGNLQERRGWREVGKNIRSRGVIFNKKRVSKGSDTCYGT